MLEDLLSGEDLLGPETVRFVRLLVDNPDEPPLDRLRAMRLIIRHWNALLVCIVESCREKGCTWDQIGDALGISRQAVAKRFGDEG